MSHFSSIRVAIPLATLALVSLVAPDAAALVPWDLNEHRLGATYLSAQSGNGNLTVGVAPLGEVTVLSWPSPSYFDHVAFETEASDTARDLQYFGAHETEGVFGGLRVTTAAGDTFTWLRDAAWSHQQRYASDTSAAVEHVATNAFLGLTVTQWTTVDPERDVVLRRTLVERDDLSDVTAVRYVLYANLAPSVHRDSFDPRQDDSKGDFAAYWDGSAEAMVHFRPSDATADLTQLDQLMNQPEAVDVGAQMRTLQADVFDPGVAIVVGGDSPAEWHVGIDIDTPCTEDLTWTRAPESAFDAAQGDTMTGSTLAACRANFALGWDADLGVIGAEASATFDVFWGAGSTSFDALETFESARADGFEAGRDRADAALTEMLADQHMPEHDGLGPEVVAFSQRSLIALHQGTDADTAAMVASISTQPAYHLDWPRDSVFFDLGLDVAGEFDLVSRHKRFLAARQNKTSVVFDNGTTEVVQSPPGAWLMNFFADGLPGTTSINQFEIDQVGLMLWGFWAHAAYGQNDAQQRDALASAWPAIERGADLLAACLDPSHPALAGTEAPDGHPNWWPAYEALVAGEVPDADARAAALAAGDWEALRPCEANEDDNPIHSVSIYSTHTTRMGLLAAARAARALCIDDPRVDYWEARAHELATVAFRLYYEPGVNDAPGNWVDLDGTGADDRADWILWPEELAVDPTHDVYFEDLLGPQADTKALRTAVTDFTRGALDDYASFASTDSRAAAALETDGASYIQKKTLTLARYWDLNPRSAGRLAATNVETIRILAEDLPIPGTRHLGEVWISLDPDNDLVYDSADQRVAQPHLWTQMLTYLSAMAVAAPERFPFEGAELGPWCSEAEEPVIFRDSPACGCEDDTTETLAQGSTGAFLLAIALPALARRRRR